MPADHTSRRRSPLFAALLAMTLLVGVLVSSTASAQSPCPAPEQPLEFTEAYIDESRAGGEPLVETHPDGTLLWGSHAGTTHFFSPAAPDPTTAAFLENYEGQTYQYFSEDQGETWNFAPRTPINADPQSGLPNSGFSDPEFTIDTAGNVFISEINLANIAFSKSSDSGRTYDLQNVVGISFSDRQWMEADEEDVLWFVANTFGGGSPTAGEPVTGSLDNRLYKSTDGAQTFSEGQSLGGQQSSDIRVDQSDGRLYQLHTERQDDRTVDLEMWVFPNAREETPPNVTVEQYTIVEDYDRQSSIGPEFDVDAEGNLYTIWNDGGGASFEHGVYYSSSTDRGVTWSPAQRLDDGQGSIHWTWIAAGENGGVSAVWYQNVSQLPGNDPEAAGDEDGWHVMAAQSLNGLGCEESELAGFRVTRATTEPFHTGTICNGGTICQAFAIDRRLGDYLSNDVTNEGDAYIATGDTKQGGAVALPLVIRQTGGPSHNAPEPGGGSGQPPPTSTPTPPPVDPTASPQPEPSSQPQPEPQPEPEPERVSRVSGATRSGTSVELSQTAYDSADTAVIARVDEYPDALAASGLAGQLDAPVLLTPPDSLDGQVAGELDRLGVRTAYLMGGTAALSPEVAADIESRGITVERIGGAERFETAALIADEIVALGGPVSQAVISLGGGRTADGDWPDALAAGNLSAAGRAPVLLVGPGDVPAPTQAALDRLVADGSPLFITGGVEAVGPAPEAQLTASGYDVRRLAGGERYATAAAVVAEAQRQGAGGDPILLASGDRFSDALVAGPAAHRLGGAMLLVHPSDLDSSGATREYLEDNRDAITRAIVVGGASTVDDRVKDQIEAVLEGG